MQKIYIRNNGPVKDFRMEIEKINLLSGEQATGKSTIAKSIYYFKTVKTKIMDYMTQVYDFNSYNHVSQEDVTFDKAVKSELKNVFIKLFGYSWDLNPEFYMRYDYGEDLWIQVRLEKGDRNKQYISVIYSPKLLGEIKELQKEIQDIYRNKEDGTEISLLLKNEERKRNHGMIIDRINTIFDDSKETYYIPADRSMLTVMANNRAVMNNAVELDLITEMFMMLIDSVRNSFREGGKKSASFLPGGKKGI